MKRFLFGVLAVVMLLPLIVSCGPSKPDSTKYGTEETAVKVTVVIENPDYVPPTTEAAEGEEPEVDPENPEFFYNGTVDLYVKEPTIADALKAVFAKIEETYTCSIAEDNSVTIDDYADSFASANSSFWEYSINGIPAKASITAEKLKQGDKLTAVFVSYIETAEGTQEATA